MRYGAGFGMLSLLIAVAIGFYLYFGGPEGGSVGQALQVKKELEPQVQQMAGRDENGDRVTNAIGLEMHSAGAKYDAVVVETIDLTSTLASKYDLRVGDLITQIGDDEVRQLTDPDAAKDLLLAAYQKSLDLRVTRGTEKLKIAFGSGGKAAAMSQPPTASPAPEPAILHTPDNRSSLQKQLDGITKPR